MKKQLIITHPSSANFDELAAISLILAVYTDVKFRVERREPTPAELDNPDIWVVDIGFRHEAEKYNFDHHQSLDCPASFVLLAEYLGLAETMSVMTWWNFKDEVDRFGPVKSSLKYHAGNDLVNRNPIESWLTAKFANEPEVCLPLLKSFGITLTESARILKTRLVFGNPVPDIL